MKSSLQYPKAKAPFRVDAETYDRLPEKMMEELNGEPELSDSSLYGDEMLNQTVIMLLIKVSLLQAPSPDQ